MPPANEVPPMTAAAMTSSSFWTPRLVTAELRRAVWTAALIAARMPMRTNVFMIVAPDVDAAQLGRIGVAADRVDVAPEPAAGREDRS